MIIHRKVTRLLLLVALVFLLSNHFQVNAQPTISSISKFISNISSSTSGSKRGGTYLYISGTGFSIDSSQNHVSIGQYPCNILAQGATQDGLSCETTVATNLEKISGLPVTVKIDGQDPVTCNLNACKFTYSDAATPYVYEINPRTAIGNQEIAVWGSHKITDLGDQRSNGAGQIKKILIDDKVCSMLDVVQRDEVSIYDSYDIRCKTFKDQTAGQYAFTQHLDPGYAMLSIRMLQTSLFTGQNYVQRIAGQITSLPYHVGGNKGHQIEIKGTGFSPNATDYKCTVAGQDCTVQDPQTTSVTVVIPPLDATNTAFGALTKDASDTETQQKNFLGSNGFRYTRYTLTSGRSSLDWLTYLRGTVTLAVEQDSIVTEIRSHLTQTTTYVEYWRGYFNAVVDGEYGFAGIADDGFRVQISSVPNNANPSNLVDLIFADTWSDDVNNPYYLDIQSSKSKIELTTGYYYMQIVSYNNGGAGNFRLMVDMPKIHDKTVNPTWQIAELKIIPAQVLPQIIDVEVTTTSLGIDTSFSLSYMIPKDNGTLSYNAIIKKGATVDEFRVGLNKLPYYGNYGPTIVLTTKDASGAVTQTAALITSWTYRLTFDKYRNPITTLYDLNSPNNKAKINRVQNHSDPITGTFKLSLNDQDLMICNGSINCIYPDIPSNTDSARLNAALCNYYGTDTVQVLEVKYNDRDDSIHFVIEYLGVLITPFPITVNTDKLKGGVSNTWDATYTIVRQYSGLRPLYNPLPFDFLRTAQSKPQLYLTINKIPSICSDCSYEFDPTKTAVVSSALLATDTLSIGLTDPGSVGFGIKDLKISLNDVRCPQISGTATSVTGKFLPNSVGNAALPTGNNKPIVHIAQVGYADTSSVTLISVPLLVGNLVPLSTGPNGGVTATLTGKGFLLSMGPKVKINLCGNDVTNILSVTNQLITFVVPKAVTLCSDVSPVVGSSITVNDITQAITGFNYDSSVTPTITSLSTTSQSPILKKTIIITGTKFSTLANTKVFLYNSTGFQKYQLTVTAVTSTQVTCILGGGKSGQYNVVLLDAVAGLTDINANTVFNYQLIVSSISPLSGSMGGGYDITILGKNFGDKSSHNVFVGDAENALCKIKSASATVIVCTVPRMDQTYQAGKQLTVVVTGRILQESVCQGACVFKYNDAVTNNVTLPAITTYSYLDPVTITGTGLAGAAVTIGGVSVLLTTSSATSLSFVYPALPAGQYQVMIKTATGYTHPAILTNTTLKISNGISRSSGSLNGHRISVAGNGFPNGVDKYLSINLVCANYSSPLTIIEAVPNLITFETLPSLTNQSCGVNVTYQTTFTQFVYTYNSSQTPTSTVAQGVGANEYTITSIEAVQNAYFQFLNSEGVPTTTIYPATVTKIGAVYSAVPTGGYLPKGKMRVLVHTTFKGYHTVTPATFTRSWSADPTFTPASTTSSFVGGKRLTLTGAGFLDSNIQNNEITVCGLRAKTVSASKTQLVLTVPPLVTSVTQDLYNMAKNDIISGILISDTPKNANFVNDGKLSTIYTSSNTDCFIGFNFGESTVANIEFIKYMPNPAWAIAAKYLEGAKFEGSNDNTTWTTIFDIDTNQVHSGWNYWPSDDEIEYQYIRFSHNNASQCQLAEIQFSGIIYSTITVDEATYKQCDVVIRGPTPVTLANAVVYSHSKTSTVTAVSPSFGTSKGGTVITITGTNFNSASLSVTIDGIDCPITSNTTTSIVCTTGQRSTIPTSNSFVVVSDDNPVLVISEPFVYMDRWSSQDTWGGQALPRQGDSVYVPQGMSLLVDVPSTPILDAIIVEGKIKFSDQIDMTLDAHYFIVSGGEFTAGTEGNRYQHKLTITLYGGYYDKQLPIFGNKVLGCRNCKFNLHGKVRVPTWTQLAATIQTGANQFEVLQPVDWVAGQSIVVASSSFDHYQSEQRTILTVSANKTVITVSEPFKYRHYSAVEDYNGVKFPMRAEVALLTRNIKVQGDQSSEAVQFGSHMMMNGKKSTGLVASFSYAEFTRCGQPKIIGRYCTHFHMTGEMPESSVRGIAVHHSYARVLTIHATHFLLVEKNVGYHVKGHNIFIEDGIETNNVIQDNLLISSITSLTLLQSDISVASYWITNPYNTVRRNHAAGGDFYGFWYEIKQHPDGPSATSDICPMGMQVGQSRDNVAHSNVRFGLRIFKLSARKYPCVTTQQHGLQDPYSVNVAYESVFDNYTLWRNAECGFLGQQLGFTTIQNFKTADSKKGGMQFHKTNFTKELVTAKNNLIVGYSNGNAPDATVIDTEYKNARGLIASRTDGLKVSGLTFHNFGPTMTPLQSCSQCWNIKLWVVGSKTTLFQNITYGSNINGNYMFWQKWRRQIFIDLDGTLLKPIVDKLKLPPQTSGSITPYRESVQIPGHCYHIQDASWNDSTYCDQTITLRSILFTNANPASDFNAINIKSHLLDDPMENFTQTKPLNTTFSEEYMIVIKPHSLDIKNSWAMPYVVGKYYNIHWKWGIDFTHLNIAPSRLWTDQEAVVLRFNYTDNRQLYQIGHWYSRSLQVPLLQNNTALITPTDCKNGDFYHRNDLRYLFVCVSGRNKKVHEWIDLTGIKCRQTCPKADADLAVQDTPRYWSNSSIWPNNTKPKAGDNVTINQTWNLILDQPVPIFNYVEVNGLLTFDQTKNHTFQAHYIWVRKGAIRIGSADKPYTNQAKIILHGQKDDLYLVLDPNASGNKMLAVTGALQFYGKATDNVWTKLTSIAKVGDTSIQVANATDWSVGDSITIAPTYTGQTEFQKVTITAVSGNKVSFTPALEYQHYGSLTSTITNSYGTLDTRGGVGLLTRNIQILKGPDANGWGCRILVYGFLDFPSDPTQPIIKRTGRIRFDGVEVNDCGQYDTQYASLRFQRLGMSQNNYQKPNIITRTSVHSSRGMGVYITNATNLKMDNNVFFSAFKYLVYAEQVNNYTFTNNLLVGARYRTELLAIIEETKMVDDVACYEQYDPIDFSTANVTVTKNIAQGSEFGQGFVFPLAPCSKLSTYNFAGNTAGSCEVAFMYDKLPGFDCIGASFMIGYASKIGLMANPTTQLTKMTYSNFMFADNERGITLRFAHDIDDTTMNVNDGYFVGYSRPDCPTCYSDETISYCQGGYAVRMLSVTISGEQFPLIKKNVGFDVICTREGYDMKSFFNNVTFQNYLNKNKNVPYCSGMSVFQRHNLASDAVGSAHLTKTTCVNCQQSSWGYFQKPNVNWRGWFGGCGELDCTGPNNYIIYDQDGTFTGRPSQILANNSIIGNGQGCTFNAAMNGYYCLTDRLAVLQYESIAPDFNKRIMWPVYLKYDGGNWTSETNGWRQWDWMGPEPLNQRLARFFSVVKLQQNYNMTYSSQPPSDSRFQIQKRLLPTGNASDWVIIRIYYPLPNSLQVLVKNTTGTDIIVKPFSLKQGQGTDLRKYTDVCGANNFYYENGTIQFVVNGKSNCQVRVRLSNYVKLSARLSIPVLDFYNNGGATTFINNICAFLNIDPGRLKIVGVRSGSTIVDSVITTAAPSISSSTDPTATAAETAATAALTAQVNSLTTAISSGSISVGAPVLGVSVQVVVSNTNGNTNNQSPTFNSGSNNSDEQAKKKSLMIILLASIVPAIVIIILVSAYCYIKRRKERISAIQNHSEVSFQDSAESKNYKRQMIKVSQIPFEISKNSDTYASY